MDYRIFRVHEEGEEKLDFDREEAIAKAIRLRRLGHGDRFVVRDATGAEVYRVGEPCIVVEGHPS